jgi:hypothetical protein
VELTTGPNSALGAPPDQPLSVSGSDTSFYVDKIPRGQGWFNIFGRRAGSHLD